MQSPPRSLQQWLALQQAVHSTGIDLTLERVREVAGRLALLRPAFRVITVAGTNGKGSTVAYLAALLREAGHRAGAFTSPHLLRYNERIQVAGQMASDAELLEVFEAIEAVRGATTLTFFEYNLLAALLVFTRRQVQYAILEVGLGGRLDAVNIMDADAAIITSIGFDHRDWLGDTLEAIGREKAGVLRAGRPAVIADPDMVAVVEEEAARIGARVIRAQRDYQFSRLGASWRLRMRGLALDDLPLPSLQGQVQIANAASAIAALQVLEPPVPLSAAQVAGAITSVQLPGRFQVLPGPVEWILDVAHNEPAALVLARNLAARPVRGSTYVVAGILGDKDIDAIARRLQPVTSHWILCGIDDPRGLTAQELSRRSTQFAAARLTPDIAAGIELARSLARPGDRVVVCGSFLAVAPALRVLGL